MKVHQETVYSYDPSERQAYEERVKAYEQAGVDITASESYHHLVIIVVSNKTYDNGGLI